MRIYRFWYSGYKATWRFSDLREQLRCVRDHRNFQEQAIKVFEDFGEYRLVASKKAGNKNFNWHIRP